MRVTREQAAENREKIIIAAATLFREHGFDGVGLDDIMRQAGLTHGGFYRNFESKDDLAAQAVARGLAATASRQAAHTSLGAYLKSYLSAAHRDNAATGCMFAALGADIARNGQGPRHAVTGAVQAQITRLATWITARTAAARRRQAIATLSAMVGALVLSRAVGDQKLSEEILTATRLACTQAK